MEAWAQVLGGLLELEIDLRDGVSGRVRGGTEE
jgi:hypothetical protein